ncbi:hypothetical protein KQI52_04555 [bacterium]|nr:hypothetical protein [bacterium]
MASDKTTKRQGDKRKKNDPFDLAHELPLISETYSDSKVAKEIESLIAGQPTWEDTFAQTIGELTRSSNLKKPARLLAWVEQISSPQLTSAFGMSIGFREIVLRDQWGDTIKAMPMSNDRFMDVVGRVMDPSFPVQMVVLEGAVFPVEPSPADGRRKVPDPFFAFYITGIKDHPTAEDLIHIRPDPGETIANIFKEHALQQNGIVKYIKNQLVENLHIQGLDQLEGLNKALDFIIYQSFSDGFDKNGSMKLNSLVIGPPGAGKKLLTTAALILNPTGEEVASADGKLTLAGLIGNKKSTTAGQMVHPGYIPRASHGVLCIQDFHEIKRDRKPIFAMFSKLMEDGEVIDSTSTRANFKALTAIHLDTNRVSQVRPLKPDQQDIDIPVNILSRFDFVVELERGEKSQLNVADEILRQWGQTEASLESSAEGNWKRVLKRIVAYVRTYFRKAEIPEDLRDYMVERMNAIWDEMKEEFPDQKALTDFSARTSVSLIKYVKAITSASLGTVATKEDIDQAISFVRTKLRTVLELRSELPEQQQQKSKSDLRRDFIRRTFGGETVTVEEVWEAVNDDFGSYSQRTIERDLGMVATREQHGSYRVDILDSVRLTR